jgi:hypothetical protein
MMTFASWSRISVITRSSRAPGRTPVAMSMSAAGPVASPGPSTPTSAERNRLPHKGQGGWTQVGQARRFLHRLARVSRPSASRAVVIPRSFLCSLGWWRGLRRFLEVPVILIRPMLGWMCYWAFVDGRGNRLAAGRTPRAGAGVPAASGSRFWCRRRGCTARPWRPARGRWRGRRRAAPRNAPAAPRSAGPSLGRARSPPNQAIEQKFERGSVTLRSPTW